MTVRAEEGQTAMVEQTFAKHSTVDASTRADQYRRGGWSRFDESAPAYTAGSSARIGSAPTV